MATVERSRLMAQAAALAGYLLLSGILSTGFAHAANSNFAAAALVMESTGVTKPSLIVHREVAPGTKIAVAPGARLSLLHYATCSIVTVVGGTVSVGEQSLEAAEVNIESRKPGPCPHVHKISHGGPGPLGGGVVSRGTARDSSQMAEVAADGLVVIKGTRAANAVTVDVLDWNRMRVDGDIPIRQESFSLNGALPPRRPYYFSIRFRGQQEPVEVPVSISAANGKSLLILRLD